MILSHTTRREFLKDAAFTSAAMSTSAFVTQSLPAEAMTSQVEHSSRRAAALPVDLRLLNKEPSKSAGLSWGVPWPQGSVAHNAAFHLSSEGKDLPLQSWPMAYWPDGSMKWVGFASVVPGGS